MFCTNCGKNLEEGAKFCSGCGCAVSDGQKTPEPQNPVNGPTPNVNTPKGFAPNVQQRPAGNGYNGANVPPASAGYGTSYGYNQPYAAQENLLAKLSSKVNTNGIIWIVLASLQVIIGLYYLVSGVIMLDSYYTEESGIVNIISGLVVLVVAALNFVSASRDIKYSKELLVRPVGIVANFTPLGRHIGVLVYNVLFGGIIGVVGSIVSLCIRNFVLTNRNYFDTLESQFVNR